MDNQDEKLDTYDELIENSYTLDNVDGFGNIEDLRKQKIDSIEELKVDTDFLAFLEENEMGLSNSSDTTLRDKDSFEVGNNSSYPYNRTNICEDTNADLKKEKFFKNNGNKNQDTVIEYRDNHYEINKLKNQNFSHGNTNDAGDELGFYELEIADYPDRSNPLASAEVAHSGKSAGVSNRQGEKSSGLFKKFKSVTGKTK